MMGVNKIPVIKAFPASQIVAEDIPCILFIWRKFSWSFLHLLFTSFWNKRISFSLHLPFDFLSFAWLPLCDYELQTSSVEFLHCLYLLSGFLIFRAYSFLTFLIFIWKNTQRTIKFNKYCNILLYLSFFGFGNSSWCQTPIYLLY